MEMGVDLEGSIRLMLSAPKIVGRRIGVGLGSRLSVFVFLTVSLCSRVLCELE